jgi:hypothetical protein
MKFLGFLKRGNSRGGSALTLFHLSIATTSAGGIVEEVRAIWRSTALRVIRS